MRLKWIFGILWMNKCLNETDELITGSFIQDYTQTRMDNVQLGLHGRCRAVDGVLNMDHAAAGVQLLHNTAAECCMVRGAAWWCSVQCPGDHPTLSLGRARVQGCLITIVINLSSRGAAQPASPTLLSCIILGPLIVSSLLLDWISRKLGPVDV